MPGGQEAIVLILGSLIGTAAVAAFLWWADVVRPGSFRRAGLRDVGAVSGLTWLACAMGVYMAYFAGQVVGMGIAQAAGLATPEQVVSGEAPFAAIALISGVIYATELAAAALMVYLLVARTGPRSGICWRWRDLPLGLGALLLTVPVYLVVSAAAQAAARLVSAEPLDAIAHDTLRQMLEQRGSPWFWAMAAAVVIGAPVAEEIIFRLFLQSALLRWTGSAWTAIGVTSILFGAVHLGSVPWYAAAVLAFLGVALGIAFERTRRIGVPIVMHALFNAAQIAGSLLLSPDDLPPPA